MSQPPDLLEMGMLPGEELSPRHGFQGDRGAAQGRPEAPLALSIALSREAGARGGTIGRLVAKRLGWQVYDQDLLEFMAQDGQARQGLLDNLSEPCRKWVEGRLGELTRQPRFAQDEAIVNLGQLVLALAAGGEVVLIGRGTGCILPRASTLNVRIIASLPDRVRYMGQWMRLPGTEAAEKVRSRDQRRADFLQAHFGQSPSDPYLYDLVLNSGQLGEEACGELIARAAQLRWQSGGTES